MFISPVKQYHDTLNEMKKKYGELTCVLIEVGSFYEMYGIAKDSTIFTVASYLQLIVTKKNKKIKNVSMKNPYMSGFTSSAFSKYLSILLSNNFTVIQISQTERLKPSSSFKREIKRIYSPSTTIDGIDTNYFTNTSSTTPSNQAVNLVLLYVEYNKDYFTNKFNLSCGLCSLDLTRGVVSLKEVCQENSVISRIKYLNPLELIIVSDLKKYNNNLNIKSAMDKLIMSCNYIIPTKSIDLDHDLTKIDVQTRLLEKVYPQKKGMLSIIEALNLEMIHQGRIALCSALSYVYQHDKRITDKLLLPSIDDDTGYLILSKFAHLQLQTFTDQPKGQGNILSKGNYTSLESIVNNTSTVMGRREMKQRLLKPIVSTKELLKRYNKVKVFYKNKKNLAICEELHLIKDLERLHRKMLLRILKPYELLSIYDSYQQIKDIFAKLLKVIGVKKGKKSKRNYEKVCDWDELIVKSNTGIKIVSEVIDTSIDYESLTCKEIVFKGGYDLEYDKVIKSIKRCEEQMKSISCKMEKMIDKKTKLSIEFNDKIGHYIKTTSLRYKKINKSWNNKDPIHTIQVGNTCKVSTDRFKQLSLELIVLENEKTILVERLYEKLQQVIQESVDDDFFNNLTSTIVDIDISYSQAKIAEKFRYCEPQLLNEETSTINLEANELRHPIAELVSTDTVFVPNDVKVSRSSESDLEAKSEQGMVLTGMNGAGKSVYMKSIALSIIMAQSGCFVPAKTFKYIPYRHLLTRIGNGDNLLQGHSTFVCEMKELGEILSKGDDRTFVVADELCSGSEVISAKAILASTIITLIKRKSNFIFSTHIHGLQDLPSIKEINNRLVFAYIDVEKDGDSIRYTRKIRKGVSETLYGLEVCRYLIDCPEFIEQANTIRKDILGHDPDKLVSSRRSRYNSKVLVDTCQICGMKPKHEGGLDVHHIKFQSTADQCGYIEHVHKNIKANLVVLCKQHHQDVHNRKINITGWKVSLSEGLVLDYKFV